MPPPAALRFPTGCRDSGFRSAGSCSASARWPISNENANRTIRGSKSHLHGIRLRKLRHERTVSRIRHLVDRLCRRVVDGDADRPFDRPPYAQDEQFVGCSRQQTGDSATRLGSNTHHLRRVSVVAGTGFAGSRPSVSTPNCRWRPECRVGFIVVTRNREAARRWELADRRRCFATAKRCIELSVPDAERLATIAPIESYRIAIGRICHRNRSHA